MALHGDEDVLGHYSVHGSSLQPLLSESSPLFRALVGGEVEAVSQHLGHDPAGLSRLYLILHWASPSDSKAAGADEASETKAAKVQVKQRGLVHLAAFHAALSGNPAVLELLLDKGADPRQACPDGDAFRFAQMAPPGAGQAQVLALLEERAQSASPPPALATAGSSGVASPMTASVSGAMSQPAVGMRTSGTFLDAAGSPLQSLTTSATAGAGVAGAMAYPGLGVDLQGLGVPSHQDVEGLDAFNPESLPYETHELTQPEYSTDDFRMFAFKVLRCSKRFAHDWRACPFAHPTENARRRDPREFKYCAIACPDYKQGFCVRGDLCAYSHGVFECWLHPSRYRTQLCKDGANCHRPICFFAHSLPELRTPTHTWTPGPDELTGGPINGGGSGSGVAAMPGAASPAPVPRTAGGRDSAAAAALLANGNGHHHHHHHHHALAQDPAVAAAALGVAAPVAAGKAAAAAVAAAAAAAVAGAVANGDANVGPAAAAAAAAAAHVAAAGGGGGMANGRMPVAMPQMPPMAPMPPMPMPMPMQMQMPDAGLAAAAAAGAVAPPTPGAAAAAMFGFTAPRMSNAFARRHGLNPKDNAMLNLQKIALQAHMMGATGAVNGGAVDGMAPRNGGMQANGMQAPTANGHNGYGMGPAAGGYPANAMHLAAGAMNGRGMGGGGAGRKGHAGAAVGMYGAHHPGAPAHLMGMGPFGPFQPHNGNALAAMQASAAAAAAAAAAHDPAAMAALNSHLQALSLHAPQAAAAAAAFASQASNGMGITGMPYQSMGMGMANGYSHDTGITNGGR